MRRSMSMRCGFIGFIICVLVLGCAPKRMPEEGWERIPLSQIVPTTIMRYQGVRSLQAQLSVKLEVQDDFYLLRGILLYENPDSLRLQLASSLGPTVGEVIYTDGLLVILVPSEGKLYQGWLNQDSQPGEDTLFLTLNFQDYHDMGTGQFPTTIYGVVENAGVRFELRLKEPKIDLPLSAEAFTTPRAGWEVHPLADLKKLLRTAKGQGISED